VWCVGERTSLSELAIFIKNHGLGDKVALVSDCSRAKIPSNEVAVGSEATVTFAGTRVKPEESTTVEAWRFADEGGLPRPTGSDINWSNC
jgi:hypothetical protein